MMARMTDTSDLAARLALFEDERAILRNLHTYGQSIDYGKEEDWVDCFTEDGVFEIRSRIEHQPARLIEGRDALRTFISRHTRAPELWHKHMIVEPLIEVDGDTATCSCYLFVLMEHEDTPLIRVFGRYLDSLERGGDGRWRFKRRIAEIESFRDKLPPFVDGRPGA
jgi:ketosteroid isomerase-like protein